MSDLAEVFPQADPVQDLEFQMQRVRRALGNVARTADNSPWTAATHTRLLADVKNDPTASATVKQVLTDIITVAAVLNTKMYKFFSALTVFGPDSDPAFQAMLVRERELAAKAEAAGTTPDTLVQFADALHDQLTLHYDDYLSGVRESVVDDLGAATAGMAA